MEQHPETNRSTASVGLSHVDSDSRRKNSELDEFFASYRAAFLSRNADSIADHFSDFVSSASDTGTAVHVAFMSGPEWRASIARLQNMYQALGVLDAEMKSLHTFPLSTRLAQAAVRWALLAANGRTVYEFEALYTVARKNERWRIIAIAHMEVAALRRAQRSAGR